MDLTYALLADFANRTPEGKLNVLGIFNSLHAEEFPKKHPQMFLCVRLSAGPAEYGRTRKLTVALTDPDGRPLLTVPQEVKTPSASGGERVHVDFVLGMNNVEFPRPGDYQFSILVDEDEKGTVPLSVTERKPGEP